jgi:hypothetical protein
VIVPLTSLDYAHVTHSHRSHAESIVKKYWESKPKNVARPAPTTSKRGRPSTSSQQPAARKAPRQSNGSSKKSDKRAEEEEEDELDFDTTHVDSMEKYKDIADWEEKVESVDTIDRGSDGVLIVYLTM